MYLTHNQSDEGIMGSLSSTGESTWLWECFPSLTLIRYVIWLLLFRTFKHRGGEPDNILKLHPSQDQEPKFSLLEQGGFPAELLLTFGLFCIPHVRLSRHHRSNPWEKSGLVRSHATDQTPGLIARWGETCQCSLRVEKGTVGGLWQVKCQNMFPEILTY